MGALRDVTGIVEDSGPEVARRLKDEGVEVVLLTSTRPACSHAVSVVARILEEAGMTTTSIVLIEEHAQRVKPPRMLAVPFFFGNALE